MIEKQAALFSATDNKTVALLSVSIDVEVAGAASKVIISQHFKNSESCNIEAVYCFPIEESAAICGLRFVTEETEIRAIAKEKEKAFEIYDNAVESGDSPLLLDMLEKDILLISVGNLKPGEEAKAVIEYVNALSPVDGTIRLQIPTTVTPRYMPPDADMIKADMLTPPYLEQTPYGLHLSVKSSCGKFKSIKSPSHEIEAELRNPGFEAKLLRGRAELDRDFILEIEPDIAEKSQCLVSRHENKEEAALISFLPEFESIFTEDRHNSDIMFVVDCSNSMAGTSIEQAKETLTLCLQSLKSGDRFNIIAFGNECKIYYDSPMAHNEENLSKALTDISSLEAEMEGSELSNALAEACAFPVKKGCRRDIILITDGEIYNPIETIRNFTESNNGIRCYTFGVGYGASHHLIKGLARATGGAWELMQPGEDIQKKVLRQFSRLIQPAIEDLELRIDNRRIEREANALPPIYEGDGYLLFVKDPLPRDGGKITISGKAEGNKFVKECQTRHIGNDNIIPTLWAAKEIERLEEKASCIEKEENKALEIGLKYNLLSSKTSYVAVAKRKKEDKAKQRPEYRRIPITITKDYGDEVSSFSPFCIQEDSGAELYAQAANGHAARHKTELYRIKDEASWYTDSTEWCLRLLKSQTQYGYFGSDAILAEKLELSIEQLKEKIKESAVQLEKLERETGIHAITTALGLKLLCREIPHAKKVCAYAVEKAEKWLSATHVDQALLRKIIDELDGPAKSPEK